MLKLKGKEEEDLKLLSCPFCDENNLSLMEERIETFGPIRHLYYVECMNCVARGPVHTSPREAYFAWNEKTKRTHSRRVHYLERIIGDIVSMFDGERGRVTFRTETKDKRMRITLCRRRADYIWKAVNALNRTNRKWTRIWTRKNL